MPTILITLQGIYAPQNDPQHPAEPFERHRLRLSWEFDGLALYGDVPTRSPLPYALTGLGQEVYAALGSIRSLCVYLPDFARRANSLVGTYPLTPELNGRFAIPLGRLMRHVASKLAQCHLDPDVTLDYKTHDGVHWAQQGQELNCDTWPTAPRRFTY